MDKKGKRTKGQMEIRRRGGNKKVRKDGKK
jgi:hypothetical protein